MVEWLLDKTKDGSAAVTFFTQMWCGDSFHQLYNFTCVHAHPSRAGAEKIRRVFAAVH